MADVLDRTVGPVNIASGTSTLFTGTVAHVYTIKNMKIVNNSAGSISVRLGIGGVTDALLILPTVALGAGEFAEFDGILVIEGTETLQANATATGLTFTASGMDQS